MPLYYEIILIPKVFVIKRKESAENRWEEEHCAVTAEGSSSLKGKQRVRAATGKGEKNLVV